MTSRWRNEGRRCWFRGPLCELSGFENEFTTAHGTTCRAIAADLSDLEAVHRLSEGTADLDVGLLVAAAGFGTSGALLDADLGTETGMADLNCTSVTAQAWHFGSRLARRGRGGVVFMSSLLAFHGVPRAAHCAATKAYVQSLAEGLRVEWASLGVDVIASAPGPVSSGFAARANMRRAQALPAEVVARVTMQASGCTTTVRPGWLSKLLGWSLAMLPRWVQVMVITRVMKGMTAHQQASRPASGT